MSRYTKRLDDGQAVMDCVNCEKLDICHLYRCRNRLKDRLAAYEDTGLEPEVVKDMAENAETCLLAWFEAKYDMPVGKLMDLIEAKQDGRLVLLPCKVGDVVYEVHNNTYACTMCQYREGIYGSGEEWCIKIEDIDLRYYPTIAEKPLCEKQFMEVVERTPKIDWIFHHRAEFGKTVFLTREEAEKALAKEAESYE